MGVRVLTAGGSPLGPGRQSRTPQAQLATGFGEPTSSTRHMRQLPAIESRSWKQNRGISAPAASHACSSVYSGGTSISLPSMMSLVMLLLRRDHVGWIADTDIVDIGLVRVLRDPLLYLVTEMRDQTLDRPGRSIAERADGVALDLPGD